MDVQRTGARKQRIIRRTITGVVLSVLAIPLIWAWSRLKPASPPVERASVVLDTVKRGPMLREVHGLGALVPQEVLWIPAATQGRVERILVRPGTQVQADTILLELSNPELQLGALDAEWLVKAAEATLTDLRVRLESQSLDQTAAAARVESEYVQAKLKAEMEQKLQKEGLAIDLNVQLTRATANELAKRHAIEQQRLAIIGESVEAQLAAQRVQIEKLRAAFEWKKQQVEQLRVRAGAAGVLQQLGATAAAPIEVGQQVAPGAILAKVAQPSKLKAELKIAETQAKDVQIGQVASIDTRSGIIPGRVSRIDPAVQSGTVTVDVRLEGALPQGARPDLSVDGTIELERLSSVLFVGRPTLGNSNSTVTLFRVEPDGKEATRVQVRFGRSSVNKIEVLDGLKVGDQVTLSDMSQYDSYNRIRLN